jgi:hypothetical protein
VQHAEQPKQNDDRDRDADQPEQNAAHKETPSFIGPRWSLATKLKRCCKVPRLNSAATETVSRAIADHLQQLLDEAKRSLKLVEKGKGPATWPALSLRCCRWQSIHIPSLRTYCGAQPRGDRGAMSVSQKKFVNFWSGRHRPPLVGQIEKMLAFLGGRSTLRERVAKRRKMFKLSLIAGHE